MPTSEFIKFDTQKNRLSFRGEWDVEHVPAIEDSLKKISIPPGKLIIDGKEITKLDTAGAWLINQFFESLQKKKTAIGFENFSEQHQELLSFVNKNFTKKPPPPIKHLNVFARIGKYSMGLANESINYLTFIGQLGVEALQLFFKPQQWRWKELVAVIDRTGCQALIIIAMLSFMIGVVITYQMGVQLKNYGANVFVVDLLGLSILREFGPLLTAIMVAGRTGSSYTAQLGIMKINQEIDALNTMGVTPGDILLLPKIIGLVIVMPLLTIWADIFGLFGGMVMANNMLDISWHEFLQRFQVSIPLRTLIIGLGKAPVFALIIASIGCFQGVQVQGNANSLGRNTTRSVVLAIFFIIMVDAIFSVIFSKLKL